MVKRAGGNLAIVALIDEHDEPIGVIPITMKIRNFKKVTHFCLLRLETEGTPPLLLIRKSDGDVLFEATDKFMSQSDGDRAAGKNGLYIHVDFDMVTSNFTIFFNYFRKSTLGISE
jgi:hypothetical protein